MGWQVRSDSGELRDWVESMAGTAPNIPRAAWHEILSPVDLQIGSDGQWLEWDHIDPRYEPPEKTKGCLWDFIALDSDSNEQDRETFVRSNVVPFVERWGLLDFGDAGWGRYERDSGAMVVDLLESATEARNILETMVASEMGELTNEDLWWSMRLRDLSRERHFVATLPKAGKSLNEARARADEDRKSHFRALRASGQGLALQRQLVAYALK